MSKEKKRISKKVKETLEALKEAKDLAAAKAGSGANSAQGTRAGQVTARTAGANTRRPEKKKG
jgi:hypothetical protein